MRLSDTQIAAIRRAVVELAGAAATVRLFGSRLDDSRRGGDIDLLLELPHSVGNPAYLAALLSARVSRLFDGRKVDVLVTAPNLARQPIHDIALKEGVLL